MDVGSSHKTIICIARPEIVDSSGGIVDRPALAKLLNLRANAIIILEQSVGFPKQIDEDRSVLHAQDSAACASLPGLFGNRQRYRLCQAELQQGSTWNWQLFALFGRSDRRSTRCTSGGSNACAPSATGQAADQGAETCATYDFLRGASAFALALVRAGQQKIRRAVDHDVAQLQCQIGAPLQSSRRRSLQIGFPIFGSYGFGGKRELFRFRVGHAPHCLQTHNTALNCCYGRPKDAYSRDNRTIWSSRPILTAK